jgi:hydrogenase nickel incorporation protein HypA/HybF
VHEAGLMQEALDLAVAAGRGHGAGRIVRLRLRVGADSGVVPDALAFAFEVIREGTIAATAALEMETVPGGDLQLASFDISTPLPPREESELP